MINSYIALGYKCNHYCLNCPLTDNDRKESELDSQIIKKNIAELCKYKDKLNITISGGEPTLNMNFLGVLKMLGESGAYINILSNAISCKNIEFVDEMIKALGNNYDLKKFRYITAIHSYNKNIHDKLTNTPGSFDETMEALENLDKRNIHVVIKIIMNKVTAKYLKETIEFICRHFSNNIDIQLCATDYAGRCGKNYQDLYINFEELGLIVEDALDNFEKINDGKMLHIIETPLCLVDPYYWKYFDTRFRNPKLTYIAPNDKSNDNKSESVNYACNTNYKECAKCAVKSYCSGIWVSTYNLEKNKDKIIRPIETNGN